MVFHTKAILCFSLLTVFSFLPIEYSFAETTSSHRSEDSQGNATTTRGTRFVVNIMMTFLYCWMILICIVSLQYRTMFHNWWPFAICVPSRILWMNTVSGYFWNFFNGLLSRPENGVVHDRSCLTCGTLGHRDAFNSPLYNDCDVVLLESLFYEDFKYGMSFFLMPYKCYHT